MNSPPKKLWNHPPWAGHPQSWGNHYMYLPYELCTGVPIVYQMKLRCREDNRFARHHKSIKWRKREVDPGFSFKQCLWEGPGHVHTKETETGEERRKERGKQWTWLEWEPGGGREEGIPNERQTSHFLKLALLIRHFFITISTITAHLLHLWHSSKSSLPNCGKPSFFP